MTKPFLATAALCLSSLVSCIPPEPPPARFRPNPPYPPTPVVDAYGQSVEPSPQVDPEQAPAPAAPSTGGYPTATKTTNPNQVLSPYEPFNVIDVEGFQSGQLARDPSNRKIFRIP